MARPPGKMSRTAAQLLSRTGAGERGDEVGGVGAGYLVTPEHVAATWQRPDVDAISPTPGPAPSLAATLALAVAVARRRPAWPWLLCVGGARLALVEDHPDLADDDAAIAIAIEMAVGTLAAVSRRAAASHDTIVGVEPEAPEPAESPWLSPRLRSGAPRTA